MVCPYCGATTRQLNHGLNENGITRYRCGHCTRRYTPGAKPRSKPNMSAPQIRECLLCGRETPNPRFCSSSCAASYNNRIAPKRIKQPRRCKRCGDEIQVGQEVCRNCNQKYVDWSQRTIGEIQGKQQ